METIAFTTPAGTTELSFTALGIGSAPEVEYATHAASKFTLPLPGVAPETAAVIPFESPCVIWTGRHPAGDGWAGGTRLFQGRRVDNSGAVSARNVSSTLVIEDAWYDLRFLTMQAYWQIINGGTFAAPTYGNVPWPDIVLFQATPGAVYNPAAIEGHITTGQAIAEILQYAITQGVNLQIGQLDPSLYVPYYPVRSLRCATAIQYALRPHPDCACEIDYSTTPPTFNIRRQSSLTPLTLPYKGGATAGGVQQIHLTSKVKPRPDLQVPRVGIYIKKTSTLNNQPIIDIGADIYPPNLATGLRSLDVSIDMTGPSEIFETGQITSTAIAFTTLPWWQQKVPALNDDGVVTPENIPGSAALLNTNINDGSKNCITVLDDSKNPVDLTQYPYVMDNDGTAHAWMKLADGTPVKTIHATVTGHFTYKRRKNINTIADPIWVNNTSVPNDDVHPLRVTLTNSPAGTATYTFDDVTNPGEVYPEWYCVLPDLTPVPSATPGATLMTMAHNLWLALQTLQYEFTHTILETPFTTIIKPGKHCLNLSGGDPAWQTMNALIQNVTQRFRFQPGQNLAVAETTVRCGPVEILEAGQLVQIFNLFTHRDLNKINSNERSGGLPNGGQTTAMPSATAKENSTHAEPDAGEQYFSAPDKTDNTKTNVIQHDPVNGQLVMNQLVNTTAAVNPAAPSITMAKADIVAAGTTNKAAKFQLVKCCLNDGTVKQFAILCTNPE